MTMANGVSPGDGARDVRHIFSVRAAADPEALPRILGQLARRRITPASLTANRSRQGLVVHLVLDGVASATAEIVAATLRSSVLVADVDLTTEIDFGPSSEGLSEQRSEASC